MTKLRLLGAAAVVVTSTLAGPAMAQRVVTNPGRCAQYYPDANCQTSDREIPTPTVISGGPIDTQPPVIATPTGTTVGMKLERQPLGPP